MYRPYSDIEAWLGLMGIGAIVVMIFANRVFGVKLRYSAAGGSHTNMERVVMLYWIVLGVLFGIYKLIRWLIYR